jgi:protein tyrosine/serine phosphatase
MEKKILNNKKSKYDKLQEGKVNKSLNFYNLKGTNSQISCHSKPTKKEIKYIQDTYGVNYILTLFYQKEHPEEIQKICNEFGIRWQWIELQGANYFKKTKDHEMICKELLILYDLLKTEQITLYVHCALGLHRTGTIVYTFLRLFGESQETALEALAHIRQDTRDKVGEHRIEKAERILVPSLMNILEGKEDNGLPDEEEGFLDENDVNEEVN